MALRTFPRAQKEGETILPIMHISVKCLMLVTEPKLQLLCFHSSHFSHNWLWNFRGALEPETTILIKTQIGLLTLLEAETSLKKGALESVL